MHITTHKHYDKAWVKLNDRQKKRVLAATKLLMTNPGSPQLRLHRLRGEYYPQYSISAGGDLRIHFLRWEDTALF